GQSLPRPPAPGWTTRSLACPSQPFARSARRASSACAPATPTRARNSATAAAGAAAPPGGPSRPRARPRDRDERGEPPDEGRVAGADPGDQVAGLAQLLGASRGPSAFGGVGLDLEERRETERLEVDGAIHDAERGQEAPDPRRRR